MATDFCIVSANGRMTSDPRTFDVGETQKTVFSIAVNRYFRRKGEDESTKKTTFVDCVAWGNAAKRVQEYGKKGAKVTMTGDWETDEYQKDGETIRRDHLNVRNISIFTAPSDGDKTSKSKAGATSSSEDVPF